MTIREIIHIPDPILREVSRPVERVDDELRRLLDDMLETMYDAPGIGLAGIQIGLPLRVVTIDIGEPDDDEAEGGEEAPPDEETTVEGRRKRRANRKRDPIFLINPKILRVSDEASVYEEGCLSIPEYFADVERPARVTVSHIDRDGKEQVIEADGLLATCLQHEIDHLNGILFIDHISRLKRDMVVRKFRKLAKDNPPVKLVG